MNVFRALCAAVLLAPSAARADEVLLVPDLVVGGAVSRAEATALYDVVMATLRENGFVVLDHLAVQRYAGDVLIGCGNVPCVADGLMAVPSRMALALGVRTSPTGNPELVADFWVQGVDEPVSQLVLPVEAGRERRVALQVALYALDMAAEQGPSSQAAIDAARRLTEVSVDVLVIGSEEPEPEPPKLPPIPEWEPPPAPEEEEVPDDLEEEDEPLPPPDPELAPRLYTGARGAYEAREGTAEAWYRRGAPHAGRFLVQVRGGLVHSDSNRAAISLLATDGAEVTAAAWVEGPLKGIAGRAEVFVGYAPATMVDFGAVVGLDFGRDRVTLGYMAEDEMAELGQPETFSAVRVAVQPRLRLFPVSLGPVKPYLVAAAEFGFVNAWTFEVTDAQPFPRPPGGLRISAGGGLGLSFDPHPRVGIVMEAAAFGHFGDVSGPRANGELVGQAPLPPQGSGFAVVPMAGVEIRL